MGLSFNPEFADTLATLYVAGRKTVSTSEVLAAASTSNATGRQTLLIFNTSDTVTIYIGPTGLTPTTTGIPISPQGMVRIDTQANINVYVLTASGSADVIFQEIG